MLCGHAPFYDQSLCTEEIMHKIRVGQFSCEGSEWTEVSNAAKDVIEGGNTMHTHCRVLLVNYKYLTEYMAIQLLVNQTITS